MQSDSYQKGYKKYLEIKGKENTEAFSKTEGNLSDIAPAVEKMITSFVFGDIYTRPLLDNKQRTLIVVTSLVAQGLYAQLEMHINAALNVGWKPEELVEIFIQCIPYTGFPKVLSSIGLAKKIFAERNLEVNIPKME